MVIKLTHDTYVQKVYQIRGNEYSILGNFINSNTKIKVRHNTCGHIWEVRAYSMFTHGKCPKCLQREQMKTTVQFKKEVKDKYGDGFLILGEYEGCNQEIEVLHTCCNKTFFIEPTNLLRGYGCKHCAKEKRLDNLIHEFKTHETFIEEVFRMHGEEYTVISNYKRSNEKVTIRHNSEKCNYHEYEALPTQILSGQGCPICNKKLSKGENKISETLKKYRINYISQYQFAECRNILPLPFDFAIFNDKNELILLIEYDGIQHFEPVDFAGKGEEWALQLFKETQIRDQIKNTYCRENDIYLLRIPYWELDNIEQILHNELGL